MKIKKLKNKGFTLVELLAVIVILAIILVIAVPKVMSIIEDAKKGTLESTAKMIASQAEKQKVQNTVLGNDKEITCDSVAKINDGDYASCSITFEDNTAKVTIEGSGKFEGLWVCDATKIDAEASNEECKGPTKTLVSHIQEILVQEETLNNGLVQTNAEYEGTTYDAGIRYVGEKDDVHNKVYYNCDDTDTNGVSYGANNYDYASSCEVWRIIGLFDTKTSTSSTPVKRVKIINTESTFQASWDSSGSDVNVGWGINQWGESTYADATPYAGADIMQLLNGYYVRKVGATCIYCNDEDQDICEQICDTSDNTLKSQNMKSLTSTSKNMIENVVWNTYATLADYGYTPADIYLEENGISKKYTGCRKLQVSDSLECTEMGETKKTIRNNIWTGLVGLASVSDVEYANGWLYVDSDKEFYSAHLITPLADYQMPGYIMYSGNNNYTDRSGACSDFAVWPSVYLKEGVKVIGGNGDDKPYILGL